MNKTYKIILLIFSISLFNRCNEKKKGTNKTPKL